MKSIPISPTDSPNVILEMIFRLKVKDVMTTEVITARRDDSLRNIQTMLKNNGITGVPVAENKRLFGIVSVDDILKAYENGTITEEAAKHMSKKLVVLEDDMPLSFAITYFDKYHFGRFPVLNRNRELVGIITIRDINVALILGINRELQKLEDSIDTHPVAERGTPKREFFVTKYDFENAGKASTEIKKLLKGRNLDSKTIRRCSIAAYELEMNLVVHSNSGKLRFSVEDDVVEIIAMDTGPGIEDTEQALTEGYSTANEWIRSLGFGAGMGLNNAKRVSDDFSLNSKPGGGTTVRSIIKIPPQGGCDDDG